STPAAHRDLVFEMLDRGASGVIFVCDFFEPDTITSLQTALPVLYVTRDAAQYILNNYVEAAANNKKIPDVSNDTICVITDIVFEAACKIEPVFRNTGNIMGAIINNRSNRYLIIGAHYDHLGLGGYGSSSRRPEEPAIHYGADDNASGVAGMLLLASAISKSELCDSLNFIFIAFGAEERGLLGSKFVVENMPVPIDSVVAMINLDMIGRLQSDKKIVAGGTGTAADMEKLLNDAVLHSNLVVHHQSEGYGPSDHAAFYAAGIPVMYFSTGAHPDYHTPDDSEQKINYPGMQQVLEYVYSVVRLIASNNYQMHFTEAGPRQASETRHGRGKVSFGIIPDITATDIQGLRVQAVSPGKPAYLA
ncbi:MAG TPA: M28 family peptidase, partial [Bacteroidales bacterium]|nr:M28 family peptidase [Bacteroidales bacterium]